MISAGATELLVQTGHVEARIFGVDVVVDTRAVTVCIENGRFPVVLAHLAIHGVVRVEAMMFDGVRFIVDLDVLVTIIDRRSQGNSLRSVGVHGNLGSIAEYNGTLLLLPVFDVFAVELFVGVTPVLDGVFTGRIFDGDSVLIHSYIVAAGSRVGDGFTLLLLIELAHASTLPRAASAGRAASVEVLLAVLGLVITAELGTTEVVSVGRGIGSATVMLGMMVTPAVGTVMLRHIVTDEGTDPRTGQPHKRIAGS